MNVQIVKCSIVIKESSASNFPRRQLNHSDIKTPMYLGPKPCLKKQATIFGTQHGLPQLFKKYFLTHGVYKLIIIAIQSSLMHFKYLTPFFILC